MRESNEDAVAAHEPDNFSIRERKGCLFLVADGVGGHRAGEVASATAAAAAVQEYYSPSNHSRVEPALRQAVQAANLRVYDLGQRESAYRSMETTLTALALAGSQAYVAHVGDCRAYLWRAGELRQLTSDHSEAAELVRMRILDRARARDHPGRSVLTRTVGSRLILRPDFLRQPVQPEDRFLLCSDGLWSEVEDEEIAECLSSSSSDGACQRLIDTALARQCSDNVTAQVVRVLSVDEAPDRTSSRGGWLSSMFQRASSSRG